MLEILIIKNCVFCESLSGSGGFFNLKGLSENLRINIQDSQFLNS